MGRAHWDKKGEFSRRVPPVADRSRGRERSAAIQLAGELRWAYPIGNAELAGKNKRRGLTLKA
jgi:hypothetical protein